MEERFMPGDHLNLKRVLINDNRRYVRSENVRRTAAADRTIMHTAT
ncbi:hypothetical protein IF2G_02187 [Cordyceps javanica]|nr:hypothetical protein IF2G_02187 [Cordyceps javanica]